MEGSVGRSLWAFVWLTVVILVGFALLQWLGAPTGRFVDWVVGLATFWWLLVIVTVPWNIYFKAREVLAEAAQSREAQIPVQPEQIAYVQGWASRALLLAIALHLLSAAGFYFLAASGTSPVGYVGAGAALLLTGLRPAIRGYAYVVARLQAIGEQVRYPRDDVVKLRRDMEAYQQRLDTVQAMLNTEDPHSWASQQQATNADVRHTLDRLRVALDSLRVENQGEHQRLMRDAERAVAQLSADSQFLDHVREIIRFVKSA